MEVRSLGTKDNGGRAYDKDLKEQRTMAMRHLSQSNNFFLFLAVSASREDLKPWLCTIINRSRTVPSGS